MRREPYELSASELSSIVQSISSPRGVDGTYRLMRSKVSDEIRARDDMDEILMDQYESALKCARIEQDREHKKMLYSISYILRKLAHEAHREYIRAGKERGSTRFLRLVK